MRRATFEELLNGCKFMKLQRKPLMSIKCSPAVSTISEQEFFAPHLHNVLT